MDHRKFIFILTLLFSVSAVMGGCSSGGNAPSGASGAPSSASGTGIAVLAWSAPSTNVDGTPLTDLAGYKVHYGTSSGDYTAAVNVGPTTEYSITDLAPGTYYIAVTAYDSSGRESGYSNEVSKTIL
jgi:hypothetical protein